MYMEKHLQGWKALITAKYIEFSLSPYLPRTSKNSNINKEPCQFRPVYQLINFSLLGDCTTIAFSNFLKMLRCIVFTGVLCDFTVNLISHALSSNSPEMSGHFGRISDSNHLAFEKSLMTSSFTDHPKKSMDDGIYTNKIRERKQPSIQVTTGLHDNSSITILILILKPSPTTFCL